MVHDPCDAVDIPLCNGTKVESFWKDAANTSDQSSDAEFIHGLGFEFQNFEENLCFFVSRLAAHNHALPTAIRFIRIKVYERLALQHP